MRKTGKSAIGLFGLASLVGLGGCVEPQNDYDRQKNTNYDAGDAGVDAVQVLLGAYGVAGDGTPDQRNAASFTSDFIGNEKRNDAIRNSGSKVNVYVYGSREPNIFAPLTTEIYSVVYDIESNRKGMDIKTTVEVSPDNVGRPMNLCSYLFYSDGTKVMDQDGQYKTEGGQVAFKSKIFTPTRSGAHTITTFAAYNQLDIPQNGEIPLEFQVVLWDCPDGRQGDELARFQPVGFTFRKW